MSQDQESFHYDFSFDEAKAMMYLLRKNSETQGDDSLNNLYICLQNYFFSIMTIDEAETFFL